MSNERPHDRDPPDGSDESVLMQIQDQLFCHRMTLKQHDHHMPSTTERLTLTVVDTLSRAFLFLVLASVTAVVTGFYSLNGIIPIIENILLTIVAIGLCVVGMFSFAQSAWDWAETRRKLREGPPEMPDVDTEPDSDD
jgi:hypothetical protein